MSASERESLLWALLILFVGSLVGAFLVGLILNREWGFLLLGGFSWIVAPLFIAAGAYGLWTSMAAYLSRLSGRGANRG